MGKRGDVKTENYFPGLASLIFSLRGWGGVPSILRKTSSGSGSVPSLRGSLSVIGRPSENHKIRSVIKITPAQLREGSWELWEWMGEEISIEFIDEILLKIIRVIFGEAVVVQDTPVDLQHQADQEKDI